MILAVDVDGVICDLTTPWLSLYNKDWHDNLLPSDLTSWNFEKQVLPEARPFFHSYLNDSVEWIYANAPVIEGAKEGVAALREAGARVVFVTSNVQGAMYSEKLDYLIRHGFLPAQKAQPDYVSAYDKTLIRATALIDDKPRNIEAFCEAGGYGFIFDQTYNRKPTVLCNGRMTWQNIMENKTLKELMEFLSMDGHEPVIEPAAA